MQAHWEKIYGTRASNELSWFRTHLETSLTLIERAAQGDCTASILDVGGGASTLVDDLINRGYQNVTVLDLSQNALDIAKARLGEATPPVHFVCADVTKSVLPERSFDIWHDRAVFHFLTTAEDRHAYVGNVAKAVNPGGHIVISTFGPEGPSQCSGLDVVRYDPLSLQNEIGNQLGPRLRLLDSTIEFHETPIGKQQQFVYCLFSLG